MEENHNNTELQIQLRDLENKFQLLEKEISSKSPNRPWYKTRGTLIAIVALILSFVTSYISYERLKTQDINNSKKELRELTRAYFDLPFEYLKLNREYKNDPIYMQLDAQHSTEQAILIDQIINVGNQIKNHMSSAELLALSDILFYQEKYDDSISFSKSAVDVANTFRNEIAALRTTAKTLTHRRDHNQAREYYDRALLIFEKYSEYNQEYKDQINAETYILWAFNEAKVGRCEYSYTLIDEANLLLARYPKEFQNSLWFLSLIANINGMCVPKP